MPHSSPGGGGDWAQLELTGALIFSDRFSNGFVAMCPLNSYILNVLLLVQRWSIESTPSKSQLR